MGLIKGISFPLMILNILGWIVSGIWLAILGEWGAVLVGVVLFFIATWLLGLALMPSSLLMLRAAYCAEKNNTFGFLVFGALGNIYILTLITIWCCGILFLFAKDATMSTVIPLLIWSYAVATGPWAYMASKDQGQEGEFASVVVTFLMQLAYAVIILLVLFTPISLIGVIKVFGSFMVVGFILQLTMIVLIQREARRFTEPSDDFTDTHL